MDKYICAEKDCNAWHRNKSRWDAMHANDDGWFFERNGNVWCPRHRPAWLTTWRDGKYEL